MANKTKIRIIKYKKLHNKEITKYFISYNNFNEEVNVNLFKCLSDSFTDVIAVPKKKS